MRALICFSVLIQISLSQDIHALGIAEKVKIDVRQSDNAIRQELLRHTPLNTHAASVLKFVHSQLYHEGGVASGVGIMPEPGIIVTLGHVRGVVAHRSTSAEWIFDKRQKLKDIEIRRFMEEGSD
jgi:hypothetical protein